MSQRWRIGRLLSQTPLDLIKDDADFDTNCIRILYQSCIGVLYRGVVYLFSCMEMDWGALAPGDVGLSLEIFTLPPPPLK